MDALESLIREVAWMAAQVLAEARLSQAHARKRVAHMFEDLWAPFFLPELQKLAARAELDLRPLDDRRYKQLAADLTAEFVSLMPVTDVEVPDDLVDWLVDGASRNLAGGVNDRTRWLVLRIRAELRRVVRAPAQPLLALTWQHAALERGGLGTRMTGVGWSISPTLAVTATLGRESRTLAARDPANGQLVLWHPHSRRHGGGVTERVVGDCWQLVVEESSGDSWRERRDQYLLVPDTGLGRLVRFSPRVVGVFDDGRWITRVPDPILAAVHFGDRFAVHDPATRETLVLDLDARLIIRFDLARSVLVGRYAWPADANAVLPYEATAFDVTTRTLRTFPPHTPGRALVLDLGPAFDAAAALGPRTPVEI